MYIILKILTKRGVICNKILVPKFNMEHSDSHTRPLF